MGAAPVSVVETPDFLAACRKHLDDNERDRLVDYLAHNPEAGVLIPGTGGVRKLRWALRGRGKRGGARVIYYFHSERIPLYVLKFYAKNEKSDLRGDEIIRLRAVVKAIASTTQ
jgi:mRNA-degrading endonuclease RelE of RelBE toxin-antitoxin system